MDAEGIRPGDEMGALPYDYLMEDGQYAGGHVLMLHAEGTTQLWAIPPQVIVLLQGMMADDQYRKLIECTPRLSALAGR